MAHLLCIVRFHAIDAPLVDPMELRRSNTVSSITPTTPAKKPTPAPKDWVPFSKRDSSAIEQAYQEDIQDAMVPVNEDHLFEVNVQKRTIEPIYWEGPTHQVRRATWFIQGDGKWFPCQENLAEQIETGYHKYKPYEAPAPTQESATTSTSSVKSESHEESKLQSALEQQPVEKQWNLLGAYLEQYVVYTGPDTAWLL
ncbi:hypothetical protein DM01DRAFT_258558 [Hesseltinella vesiculosa]|uniref:Uncharacterized protein n=1 Tax=Hesseltinella vesiculosa TaxID=101127 RepID=A0A1X2GK07_9FUNG|nr:hypothetical protein DM01DRAFT_258558 [Hesseltinella vesiculosa]